MTTLQLNHVPTVETVTESGFSGNADDLVRCVTASTQGFTLMLAGLKAYLEHGVQLNLTWDWYPPGIAEPPFL